MTALLFGRPGSLTDRYQGATLAAALLLILAAEALADLVAAFVAGV